ncbi:hypothetical protein HOY82DRAFT_563303 [Tuber indicum]|nr:hypothetical protein HOY82DRAFT_563303 [Tuber indicum]
MQHTRVGRLLVLLGDASQTMTIVITYHKWGSFRLVKLFSLTPYPRRKRILPRNNPIRTYLVLEAAREQWIPASKIHRDRTGLLLLSKLL